MLLSYFVGQKKYPINYDVKRCMGYVALAAVFYIIGMHLPFAIGINIALRTILLITYTAVIVKVEGFDISPLLRRFKH
jgi:hypothetical protein